MGRSARGISVLAASIGLLAVLAATLVLGSFTSADPSTPGGDLRAQPGTVVDNASGTEYHFGLRANEDAITAGKGSVALALGGPALSLCTARSTGGLGIDWSTQPESGPFPYQNVQCGRAFGQTVAVDGCIATIKAHGFVHSDDPNTNVLDGMTIAVRFQKTGPASANFDATILTVGRKIDIHGKATTEQPIVMPTCP